ncbi:MAG: Integration host factor subunit beta [Myxococcota bacterium]|nr:Integration host factor subunit beta [Myxococcota bacterium]
MTKSQLISKVSAQFPNLSRRDVEEVVNAIFDGMAKALKDRERIEIRGFGSFSVKHREPREARNPKTGQMVKVGSKDTPFFTAGKELRLRVDNGGAKSRKGPAND